MSVGENIRKLRKERKLTQQQLADKIGISRSYLGDIEKDRKSPSTKTLSTLAEKLGVSMFYLTTGGKSLSDISEEGEEVEFSFSDNFIDEIEGMKEEAEEGLQRLNEVKLSIFEVALIFFFLRFLKKTDIYGKITLISTLMLLNKIENKENEEGFEKDKILEDIEKETDDLRKMMIHKLRE